MITSLDKVCSLLSETTPGVAELERPEEIISCLEVRSNCEDFVDDVLNADESVFSQSSLDDGVVCKSCSLVIVYFTVASLVDELSNCLEIRVAREEKQ